VGKNKLLLNKTLLVILLLISINIVCINTAHAEYTGQGNPIIDDFIGYGLIAVCCWVPVLIGFSIFIIAILIELGKRLNKKRSNR
jgi:uncharacterized membrane protein